MEVAGNRGVCREAGGRLAEGSAPPMTVTMHRAEGMTGVQAPVREFKQHLEPRRLTSSLITPSSSGVALTVSAFGAHLTLSRLRGAAGVMRHRPWREVSPTRHGADPPRRRTTPSFEPRDRLQQGRHHVHGEPRTLWSLSSQPANAGDVDRQIPGLDVRHGVSATAAATSTAVVGAECWGRAWFGTRWRRHRPVCAGPASWTKRVRRVVSPSSALPLSDGTMVVVVMIVLVTAGPSGAERLRPETARPSR